MDRYDYSAMTPETVRTEMDSALEAADRLVAAAVTADPPTWGDTIVGLSDASGAVIAGAGRSAFPGSFHPDPDVRQAAAETEERRQNWDNALAERDDVAAAIGRYSLTPEASKLEGPRRRALELWQRVLRRAGHELDSERRAELGELRRQMVALSVAFDRNLSEWQDQLVLSQADLAGLSDSLVAQLPDGDEPGTKHLPIVREMCWPFIEQSERRDLREQALKKNLTRAVEQNRPIFDQLLDLRRRVAALMGFPSWSDYANEARMSGSAKAVEEFLGRLVPPLQALAERERTEMRRLAAAHGIDGQLQAWDWPFLHERQRRALGISSTELSAHFPLEQVLAGLFDIARDVFGVVVREETEARGWHPDVRLFALVDADSGEHLTDVYIDPFARDGKRPGAWAYPLVPPDNRAGEQRRPATMMLISNSARADDPARTLLEHDDVAGLFHEFGHILEFGISRAELVPAFDDWIERDFVEAPSQIMENWAWEPEVLLRFARHHETGQPPAREMLERVKRGRQLNVGIEALWNLGSRAVLDHLIHGPDPITTEEAYERAFAVTGWPFPEGTYQPSSFLHAVSGYDAGFYSYLWARAFGDDMFSEFVAQGVLSPVPGRRYRERVLEPSWIAPGRERARNFLGREPSDEAFLERLGIAAG
jgi:thimet oligopeptidase